MMFPSTRTFPSVRVLLSLSQAYPSSATVLSSCPESSTSRLSETVFSGVPSLVNVLHSGGPSISSPSMTTFTTPVPVSFIAFICSGVISGFVIIILPLFSSSEPSSILIAPFGYRESHPSILSFESPYIHMSPAIESSPSNSRVLPPFTVRSHLSAPGPKSYASESKLSSIIAAPYSPPFAKTCAPF